MSSSTVTPISTETNTAGAPITVGSDPFAIAITPDGSTAYVANVGSGTVTPISIATCIAGPPIPVGSPSGAPFTNVAHSGVIAITPDGSTAYVVDYASGTVTPISTATNTAGAPITVGSGPFAIAITPDGSTAYVVNRGSDTVTPISTATNTAGAAIKVGRSPSAIAITPDGSTAYVANTGWHTVTPINVATNTARPRIPVGHNPRSIAITPDGSTAYVANGAISSGTVTPVDVATGTALPPITATAYTIAITPDGSAAYVLSGAGGAVTPIDVGTNTALPPITDGGRHDWAIAFTPDGSSAYVANNGSGTVTPISTSTNTAGTPIPVGPHPVAIAISPATLPDPTSPPSTVSSVTLHGGYTAAGTAMRDLGYGTISITGVPAGATVTSATLLWDFVADHAHLSYALGSFSGTPIRGTAWARGPSPCWAPESNFSYDANVTSLVTGNGSYALAGFATGNTGGGDPWSTDPRQPLLEGATLVVVYEMVSLPETTIQIAEGAAETDSGDSALATLGGFTASSSPSATTTYIVADGQEPGNTATFDGTYLPDVSFPGADPQAVPNYSEGNLWDTVTTDVSALVSPGDTAAAVGVTGEDDCLVWVGQVLAVSAASGS